MEITWYGHSCFRLTERGMATVVTDPFDHTLTSYKPLKLKADIVTASHDSPAHNNIEVVKGYSHFITGPGEFEIGGVFITGVRPRAQKNANQKTPNTLFVFDYDKVTIAHLGNITKVPNQTDIEALGNVNIALVPVGVGNGLTASKAVEVVSILEPGIVIPMHFNAPDDSSNLTPVSKFLKEMGVGNIESQPTLKITRAITPGEISVVVLDPQA
jgi:L-ascorbate metabolism protein UlaG (beta-lactamase superfamily)